MGDAGEACRHCRQYRRAVPCPFRSARATPAANEKQSAIVARIEEKLQAVESLDEDRILRRFINAVQSAIRTNFYQIDKDGQPKPLISIKFESRKLDRFAAAATAL